MDSTQSTLTPLVCPSLPAFFPVSVCNSIFFLKEELKRQKELLERIRQEQQATTTLKPTTLKPNQHQEQRSNVVFNMAHTLFCPPVLSPNIDGSLMHLSNQCVMNKTTKLYLYNYY